MSVQATSTDAYHAIKSSGKMTDQQQKIMESIDRSCEKFGPHDFSLQEISANTKMPINVVSGRVNELKEIGVLVECAKRPCRVTKRTICPVMPARYRVMGGAE